MFHSSFEEALNQKVKHFLSHLTFKTSAPKQIITEHSKPLMIVAGQDILSQIGIPNLGLDIAVGQKPVATYDIWKQEYVKYFPTAKRKVIEAVDLSAYPEPSLDILRQRKL